ncbi:MAG: hypothetical protein LBB54_06080, partial [Cellulomonadaceae bacterium]|nr:hypothetical protein [Cellulomonadaceae bacterium]
MRRGTRSASSTLTAVLVAGACAALTGTLTAPAAAVAATPPALSARVISSEEGETDPPPTPTATPTATPTHTATPTASPSATPAVAPTPKPTGGLPEIITPTRDATVGQAYVSQVLRDVGDSATITILAGRLPVGLVLDAGLIRGIPLEGGTFTFTLVATNTAGTIKQAASISVDTLTQIGGTPEGASLGVACDFAFELIGDGKVVASISKGALPPGLRLTDDGKLV